MHRNIVLVGFMGTGKSTVGQEVARILGWAFKDSDAEVVEQAGITIPEIFAVHGEGRFRELETEALRNLLSKEKQVIATGGGAVLKEENRSLMQEGGLVAALNASEATIVARVKGDTNRPLLAGDVEERVRILMEARRDAYRFAPLQIDTDPMTVEQVAAFIAQQLQG